MKNKIWVKLFSSHGKYYCYDVGTNHIMEIEKALYKVLKKYNYSNRDEVLDLLSPTLEKKKIRKAFDEVEKFHKEQGGFILRKNLRLNFPFTEEEYQEIVKNLANHMVFNITEKCNFRCEYCKFSGNYTNARTHNSKSMTFSTMKKAINFFIENASHIIKKTDRDLVLGFYGGEPLIEYKNIFRAVEYIKTHYPEIFDRFRFSLTTNGTLFNEENIKKFIKYNFSLLVSMDGPKEVHDRYRRTTNKQDSFDIIKRNLKLIKGIDKEYFMKKVGFSIVLAPEYKLSEIYDFFKTDDFSEERVYLFSNVDADGTNFFDRFDMVDEFDKLRESESRLKKMYMAKKLAGSHDVLLSNLFESAISDIHRRVSYQLQDKVFPNGICLPGLQKIFVDTDGNFHLCEKIDWNFSLGNIHEGFNTERIFELVKEYIKTTHHCKNCWAIRFCKDCYISSLDGEKFSRETKKGSCKISRRSILKGLKDYVYISERNPDAFGEVKNEESIMLEAYKFLNRI